MKTMIVNEFGAADVFELAEVNKPVVKPGHVLIKVAATSVNPVDTMIRQMGAELPLSPAAPAILGMDVAGTIEQVGEGVENFQVGDEVYGCAGGLADLPGALAEYMLADSQLIAHKPKSLSMTQAASLPLVAITAYEGLMRAGIKSGQNVLVHGGAGGVGHIALQLAKHFGAKVFATGSDEEKMKVIEALGATAINYKTQSVSEYVAEHTDGIGFDIVFDSVGGTNMAVSFDAAKLNGQVASTVAMVEMDLSTAHFKGLSLHVVFMLIPMLYNQGRSTHGELLKHVAEIVDAGDLTPIIDSEYVFTDVASAHKRVESGQAIGKVVVNL